MEVEGKEIVMLSKQDYDKMIELAEMNQQRIETKAVELWENKGVAKLKVTMEIRSNGGRSIVDNEQFKFDADCFIYNNERRFCIPQKTKESFSKMMVIGRMN